MRAETELPMAALEKDLHRFESAGTRGQSATRGRRGPAISVYDRRSSWTPARDSAFDQLTWQVRIFICALRIRGDDRLRQMLDEIGALQGAIAARNGTLAEPLWREKFER